MKSYNQNKFLRHLGLLCLTIGLLAINWQSSHAAPGDIERVSVDSIANQGNNESWNPSISGDGRFVAFDSLASNLVNDDTNGASDVFVYDQQTGTTTRVSVNSDGYQAYGWSFHPSISSNGRFVAFDSSAAYLVSEDDTYFTDVFLHDRQTGVTTRVSVDNDGNGGNEWSGYPSISSDSRFIAFSSEANNLVNDDGNDTIDIFVHDRLLGVTTRVSVGSSGNESNGSSWYPSISGDGRYVAFESFASNLVSGDTNGTWDIFVHDRQTGTTTRVSVNSSGLEGNGWSGSPNNGDNDHPVAFDPANSYLLNKDSSNTRDISILSQQAEATMQAPIYGSSNEGDSWSAGSSISSDGRFVTFQSDASNLVNGDNNGKWDIFLHDRQTGTTTRISVDSNGNQANDWSGSPSISSNGRFITFDSPASNLVNGDTNNVPDVFMYDRQTGATTRVSVSNGNQGNNGSHVPSISSDGRFIAFHSSASNLVNDDNNGTWDIFIHDRQIGTTTRASVGTSNGDGNSWYSSVSDDGRFVAFESEAANLVGGDTNGTSDVFLYDKQTGITTRVSVDSNGNQGNSGSWYPSISSDGRFIAFHSSASNLVSNDNNGTWDIFIHDRQTRITTQVSVDSNGNGGDSWSARPRISSNGRFVTFYSYASNLVNNDNNDTLDIFVRDQQTGATTRVSVGSGGSQGNDSSYSPSISNDGRFVTFYSYASNLVSNDNNDAPDVFVHDRQSGTTTRVSVSSNGGQGNDSSYSPSISGDGRFITFSSGASNLVSGDTNGAPDIFVHDRQTGVTTRVSIDNSSNQANDSSYYPRISSDGRFVTFYSYASNLVSNDSNNASDIFVHDRQTGTTTRITVNNNGDPANNYSYDPSISSNGRFVTFDSAANNLADNDSNNNFDVFVHDRQTNTTSQASVNGYSDSHLPSVSGNGRFVAFFSYASNLVNHDTNGTSDIFVHDRQTKITTRVSVSSSGDEGNSWSDTARLSSDGRYVVFRSWANNLVNNDSNGVIDIFVHDQQTGSTTRASVSSSGSQGNQDSYDPSINSDGRYVVFSSMSSNLVNNDSNNASDIFVHDRQTGSTTRISTNSSGSQGNNGSYLPSISSDGRFVTFSSNASNLVGGDTNSVSDIFVRDRQTGTTTRVSINSSGSQSNGDSSYPTISGNGRFVAFQSDASNLVNNDSNNSQDIFIHDRQTGKTTRVSLDSNGSQGNSSSWAPSISSDGRFISFDSFATNLVSGDNNNNWDAFVHDQETGTTIRASVNGNGSEGNDRSEWTNISGNGRFVAFRSYASNLVNGDGNGVADIFVAELEGSITSIYLPILLKDRIRYFEGPWEQEDNDSAEQANGPLRPNQTYNGYPDDAKDYFFIHLNQPGRIVVDLQNYPNIGQLQLFHQSTSNRVAYATAPPYHLDYTGAAGTYYIYIATTSGFNNTTPYLLKVDY